MSLQSNTQNPCFQLKEEETAFNQMNKNWLLEAKQRQFSTVAAAWFSGACLPSRQVARSVMWH